MSLSRALSTNNYGPCKFIVATSAANGTHTTLAAALAAASVGDTVFLRDSVTENVTLPAGVNIAAWSGSSLNVPSITGTVTMTAAGTSTISGIRLVTNSANNIAVTGSAASILNLVNCYLNCTNNTGISFTSSSSSARIFLFSCNGDLGTTGIGFYSMSSAGQMRFFGGNWTNSGGSTTASSNSAGGVFWLYAGISFPISTSSTGQVFSSYCNHNTSAQNATCVTTAGTGISTMEYSDFISGTASAISIGSGTIMRALAPCRVESSNTNSITGAGTLVYPYGEINFSNASSSTVNVTTQTADAVLQPQGLWTPVLTFNTTPGSGAVYTTQFGWYAKYNNLVSVVCGIVTTNKGSTSGNLGVGGFPFAFGSNSGNYGSFAVGLYAGLTFGAGRTQCGIFGNAGLTVCNVQCMGSGVAAAPIADTAVANATTLYFSGVYSTY